MTRNNYRNRIGFTIACICGLVVIAYGYFASRYLLEGPQVEVLSPANGISVSDSLLTIKGVAKNISYISLNDKQIYVDRDGNFNEKLLLYPGYTIIKVKVKDRFGRVVEKNTEVVLSASS